MCTIIHVPSLTLFISMNAKALSFQLVHVSLALYSLWISIEKQFRNFQFPYFICTSLNFYTLRMDSDLEESKFWCNGCQDFGLVRVVNVAGTPWKESY